MSLLTGGLGSGTNVAVAANTQAGRTNSQTVGTTNNTDQRLENVSADTVRQSNDSNKVQADEVQTVVINEIPIWIILLLLLGWLLPTPQQIGNSVVSIFKRK